jgi:NTE family protein
MTSLSKSRVAVACQGGGSHAAFTAGVLIGLLSDMPDDIELVALSGTSGGAMCAALAWDGLLRRDPSRGCDKLRAFWDNISTRELWDRVVNQSLVAMMSRRDFGVLPIVTPYHLPPWGEKRLRSVLNQCLDFDELRALARRPSAPVLKVGAVEVRSGEFEVFTGEDICVEALLASAAIPDLFRAVEVPGRGVYWDGLFSQNPPIKDLVDYQLDEIWVIQINPSRSAEVPTQIHQIFDRRNELSGNLSMVQELNFIEAVNRFIDRGELRDPKYRLIQVGCITLDRNLDYRSKLDRSPALVEELMKYGQDKWRWFLKERASKTYASKYRTRRGVESVSEQLPSE